jgi:dihydrodipicolinate synthase/N-acetylneuraminate lyase
VIAAQGDLVDTLFHHGVTQQLDGIFSLAPHWISAIAKAAMAGDWESAAQHQQRLSMLLRVLKKYGIFQTFTALLNARGVEGSFAPAPMALMSQGAQNALFAEPIVQDLLANHPAAGTSRPSMSNEKQVAKVAVPAR